VREVRGRAFLHGITPPYVAAAVRRVRRRRQPSWEYVGTTWVDDDGDGWNVGTVAEQYARKLPEFRAAIAAPNCIGVPTEALLGCTAGQYNQNLALSYAYAVARAAAGRNRMAILDWGGGFGFMALVVRELFPELEVEFHVKEVPATACAARETVEGVTFWDDDACLDRAYDLVSACGSFQYSPDWRSQLARFGAAASFVLLTRTPVAETLNSFVVRQHAYETSYVGWVFSRAELLAAADAADLSLERELLEGWSAQVRGAPARDEHRAYLFSNRRSRGSRESRASG
jgi:putative methyltransferase (TIGR04325 family)